jgi:hypothetical protein
VRKPNSYRVRGALPVVGVWVASAAALAVIGSYVADWFSMTDELRYERLAISIARAHSLVPKIHGVDIRSFSQLYPLLIAPTFAHGSVPGDLRAAHVLNAVVMCSACIPVFLLARRAIGRRDAALAVAAVSVVMPWMVYGTTLLTEVAAYPAFAWAVYALVRAVGEPSPRHDVFAVLALALAYFARTALVVLVVVLPAAVLAFELGRGRRRVREVLAAHRLLVGAYVLLLATGMALEALGRFSAVFGVYGYYAQNQSFLSSGLAGSFTEHAATFALALGILPFVVGTAWLLAAVVRPPTRAAAHAFASVSAIAVVAVLFQATVFDVRYTGFVHDRFLLYLVPLVLTATFCAALGSRPSWSLVLPVAVVALGFVFGAIPRMSWADPNGRFLPDAPAAILYSPIVRLSHGLAHARVALVVATIVLAVLFVQGSLLLHRGVLAVGLIAFTLVAVAAATGYVFARYLRAPSWSNRPLSNPQAHDLAWIDRAVGTGAHVALVPYPVSTDYFVSQEAWRDLEFWNESAVRDVHWPASGAFAYTGFWFPKLYPHFDLASASTDVSGVPYAVESVNETRFGLAGRSVGGTDAFALVHAGSPWQLSWVSSGLYDDGWTKPGVTARIRLFPAHGQTRALTRYLTLILRPPYDVKARGVEVSSNLEHRRAQIPNTGATSELVRVCVPPRGSTEVRLRAATASPIPGDEADPADAGVPRAGGVNVRAIALSDNVGSPCRPRA